jgi:hypothetical protein
MDLSNANPQTVVVRIVVHARLFRLIVRASDDIHLGEIAQPGGV